MIDIVEAGIRVPASIGSGYRSTSIRSLPRRFLKNFRITINIRMIIKRPPFYSVDMQTPLLRRGFAFLVESMGPMQTATLQVTSRIVIVPTSP